MEDVVTMASSHTMRMSDVGVIQTLSIADGETGEITRLDNHVTFHCAGRPILHSWHEGQELAPVQTRRGLTHVRPAHQAHRSAWDGPCELTIVALTPPFLAYCAADLFKRDLAKVNLRSTIARSDPLLWCLGMRLRELASPPDVPLAFMDQIAATMAMHLLLTAGADPVPITASALSGADLRRVTSYVEANLAIEIRLADLASLCALSPFHFARQFKRETGVSPARFIRLRRMDTARRLLVETKQSVEQIGSMVGYQDGSAFRRAFAKEIGVSPAALRRNFSR